jgi:hypothetical protein
MMRKISSKENEDTKGEDCAIIEMLRKFFIINVTFNVDSLIADSFGNYVIQFCY